MIVVLKGTVDGALAMGFVAMGFVTVRDGCGFGCRFSDWWLRSSKRSQALKKGIWWMPWHREAMKDVARCEKPRGAVSKL